MKNQKMIIGLVIAVVLIAMAYFAISSFSIAQTVKVGDNVWVYYIGSYTNGTVFDSNVGKQPFNFTVGANQVIPGFEQAVIGMGINQTKNVTIPPNQAYGPVNPNLFVKFPIKAFGNQTVRVGMVFTETTTGYQVMRGVVTSVNATNATLNFNPPLAGQTLLFTIKVVAIKKAQ